MFISIVRNDDVVGAVDSERAGTVGYLLAVVVAVIDELEFGDCIVDCIGDTIGDGIGDGMGESIGD